MCSAREYGSELADCNLSFKDDDFFFGARIARAAKSIDRRLAQSPSFSSDPTHNTVASSLGYYGMV